MARIFELKTENPRAENVSFRIDYAGELNQQQFQAVTTLDGPLLCIAGAGSGKTRTLVYRVARMVEEGIQPESILLLTFTRKAARNMLDRASRLVGEACGHVAGGTYHSFANMILRQYGSTIGLSPSFSILDESDASDILNHLRGEIDVDFSETRFPQKKTLHEILSRSINRGIAIPQLMETEFPHFIEHLETINHLLAKFATYKKENHLLDYDDLLVFFQRLLEEREEIRHLLGNRFRYVMADEYQDTNRLQARITCLLAGKHRNVMVVGDDAQTIYSFRGADFRNIMEFPREFPEVRIIRLEENFRSTRPILTAANALMKNAREGFPKSLFTRKEGGNLPARVACMDDAEQAGFVAQVILQTREEGVPLSQIAVLFRSGFHSFQLEIELKRRNIPFVKWGGFKFLDASHIKDVLSHLRVLNNPSDRISWMRVLMLLPGIGSKTAQKIIDTVVSAVSPFSFEGVKVPPRAGATFEGLLATFAKCLPNLGGPPRRLIETVAEYYFPIMRARFDDFPKRGKDLDQLALLSDRFSSLAELLGEIALEPPRNSVDEILSADPDDEDRLILSTIHSAKGLEWHTVFVIWNLEGRFPSFSAISDPDLLEEERRLLYVAMTRARENLFLTFPLSAWDGPAGSILQKPSRFLGEIGRDLLEPWEIRHAR